MFKSKAIFAGVMSMALLACTACGKSAAPQDSGSTEGQVTEKESEGKTEGKAEAGADVITITYGLGFNPGTPQARAADEFKARVEKESNGRILVDVFPAGQLGSAREMFESVQMGSQEIALLPTARISGFSPTLQIFDLPFLFPDRETAYQIFDSEVGEKLLDTLSDTGVKGLAIYEDGFKHFTCSKKLEKLEDFKGLKFRTMESPIIMEQFQALGANPVPIDFSELYNALQQGTVDGQENPLVTIDSVKLYEVQDYLLYSQHAYLGHVFLTSKSWYDGLDDELKEIVTRNAKEIAVWERSLVAEEEVRYLDTIKASGTTVIELSAEERARMKEALSSVYAVAEGVVGKDLLDMVTEAAGQ